MLTQSTAFAELRMVSSSFTKHFFHSVLAKTLFSDDQNSFSTKIASRVPLKFTAKFPKVLVVSKLCIDIRYEMWICPLFKAGTKTNKPISHPRLSYLIFLFTAMVSSSITMVSNSCLVEKQSTFITDQTILMCHLSKL